MTFPVNSNQNVDHDEGQFTSIVVICRLECSEIGGRRKRRSRAERVNYRGFKPLNNESTAFSFKAE